MTADGDRARGLVAAAYMIARRLDSDERVLAMSVILASSTNECLMTIVQHDGTVTRNVIPDPESVIELVSDNVEMIDLSSE